MPGCQLMGDESMIQNKNFTVVGGDPRQSYLAGAMAARENGWHIYALFLEKGPKLASKIETSVEAKLILPQSDVIIFPLPLLGKDMMINTPLSDEAVSLEECLDYIAPEAVVLAGKVSSMAAQLAKKRGIELIDYLNREEFSVLNAVPTALYKLR